MTLANGAHGTGAQPRILIRYQTAQNGDRIMTSVIASGLEQSQKASGMFVVEDLIEQFQRGTASTWIVTLKRIGQPAVRQVAVSQVAPHEGSIQAL